MRRRDAIRALGGAALWPVAARCQQSSNPPMVAVLSPASIAFVVPRVDAVRKGLQEAGLLEGTHYIFAIRSADGQLARLPDLARELESLKPAVLVVGGSLVPFLEKHPTTPVVFTAIAADPVEFCFAQSYARPGGMMTGNVLNALGGEDTIAEKRITLFKELVPSLKLLGMFGPSPAPGVTSARLFRQEESAALRVGSRLGFETKAYRLKTIDDLESAIALGVRDRIDGMYLSGEPLLFTNFARALPLIMGAGKPAVGPYVEWARAGVLMTYSTDLLDGWRRAGLYAGKIMQGAKPGELPIEQPTKFTLAINEKTAEQLGISIPPALQATADELIE